MLLDKNICLQLRVEIHCGVATRQLPEVVVRLCFVAILILAMLPQEVIFRFAKKVEGEIC